MGESAQNKFVRISAPAQAAFIAGALDAKPVRGLTHNFYKYPARFSPSFARAAIEGFTRPGDLVLDNHVGGGTTLVEALATGRDAIGVDISTLAEFVTRVKTTLLSDAEMARLETWLKRLPEAINIRKSSIYFGDYADAGYYRHLNDPIRWRLRKAIEQGVGSAMRLGDRRLESFARCVVLRTAQWALDGRVALPSLGEFREMLQRIGTEMLGGSRALRAAVEKTGRTPTIDVINRTAAGLDDEYPRLSSPRLVLTSPPYPGVHVLYHRWQVDGRKETPAPFWIAGRLDGAAGSYYTMGDRKQPQLNTYFENIKATMASIARLADRHTVIVQMVAFSDATWQLDRYLHTMEEIGLRELFLADLHGEGDGRLRRIVPNRRWYSDQQGMTPGSQEIVLIHVKRRANSRRADTVSARPPLV